MTDKQELIAEPDSMELELRSKFKIAKEAVQRSIEEARSIVVEDHLDEVGMTEAKLKRKELRTIRLDVSALGKELRADAIRRQKLVLSIEKDLLSGIPEAEAYLKEQEETRKRHDEELAKQQEAERAAVLKCRMAQLKEIEVTLPSASVEAMDNDAWDEFISVQSDAYQIRKQREVEEQERLEAQRQEQERKDAELRERHEQMEEESRLAKLSLGKARLRELKRYGTRATAEQLGEMSDEEFDSLLDSEIAAHEQQQEQAEQLPAEPQPQVEPPLPDESTSDADKVRDYSAAIMSVALPEISGDPPTEAEQMIPFWREQFVGRLDSLARSLEIDEH